MTCRKWLVRGLVFTVLGAIAAFVWVYQSWTSPHTVCALVIARLEEQFAGARVCLDRAGLRLLGGISFRDLRMTRRDDPENLELLHVPSGIIYHDKEQLLNGKLMSRKIELYRPRFHILRRPDGTWNLEGVLGLVDPNEPIPTIVIRQGTFILDDRRASGQPPLEIRDIDCTLINDPLPVLHFEVRGQSPQTGALTLQGAWQRHTMGLDLTCVAAEVPINRELAGRLGCYCTMLGDHAQHLEAWARLEIRAGYDPEQPEPWSHTLTAEVHNGKLRHPDVPLPLDEVAARLECRGGRVTLHEATARHGDTRVRLEAWAQEPFESGDVHTHLQVENLDLHADLFACLPQEIQYIQQDLRRRAGLISTSRWSARPAPGSGIASFAWWTCRPPTSSSPIARSICAARWNISPTRPASSTSGAWTWSATPKAGPFTSAARSAASAKAVRPPCTSMSGARAWPSAIG